MKYDDIIDLPRHKSLKYAQMPQIERAAQFSPFAALSGYGEAIEETRRLTQEKALLTDEERGCLNDKLNAIDASADKRLTVTWFVQDQSKNGGEYRTASGCMRRIDREKGLLILEDGGRIPLDDIYSLT